MPQSSTCWFLRSAFRLRQSARQHLTATSSSIHNCADVKTHVWRRRVSGHFKASREQQGLLVCSVAFCPPMRVSAASLAMSTQPFHVLNSRDVRKRTLDHYAIKHCSFRLVLQHTVVCQHHTRQRSAQRLGCEQNRSALKYNFPYRHTCISKQASQTIDYATTADQMIPHTPVTHM